MAGTDGREVDAENEAKNMTAAPNAEQADAAPGADGREVGYKPKTGKGKKATRRRGVR